MKSASNDFAISPPTAAMRVSGIKKWASLDAELIKLVSAWPDDYSHLIKGLYYRWAKVIRKSVVTISASPVCETAVAEVLKNLIPRFPSIITHADVQTFRNDGGDWRVLQCVADLDEPTRLRLAGIFWRWGQIAGAVLNKKWHEKWEREKQSRPAVVPPPRPVTATQQKSHSVVAINFLGPEHKPVLDWFRREFSWNGSPPSDNEIAAYFCKLAFLVPNQIRDANLRRIKYCEAEGLTEEDAVRAMVIAQQPNEQWRAS